jgi:hypothetical protein
MVRDTQVYEVGDSRAVTLEIIIGDDQAGGTSLIWRANVIDIPPNTQPFAVSADGAPLRTEILNCTTTVRDVNQNTNRTSVTYVLRGGVREREYPYSVEVPNQGEFAQYIVDFVFI